MHRSPYRTLRLIAAAAFVLVVVACGGQTPVDTQRLTVGVEGNGTVTSLPAGINTKTGATFDFVAGTEVTLTAVADDGWTFGSWTGDCTGDNPTCVVDLDGNASVTATFTEDAILEDEYDLTVTVDGTGTGGVTGDAGGIALTVGQSETYTFDTHTVVTLTAVATGDSVFTGWSGACMGTGPCEVTINADKSVTATFSPPGTVVTTSFNILVGSDDAEEYLDAVNDQNPNFPQGSVDVSSSDLDLAWDTANVVGSSPTAPRGRVAIGLRYGNVDIPAGSTITSATISFTRLGSSGTSVTFAIDGHASDDAGTFVYGGVAAPVNNDITGRTRTTATVPWTATPLTPATIESSDVSAIVQEIVDRAGWASGNALAFIITSETSSATNFFRASSFENGSPPVLNVTYVGP